MRYGYACICQSMREYDVRTNRDMNKSTFEDDDLSYTQELCERNLEGLLKVLQFNVHNDIYVFRISSMPFPWFSEWHIDDLPDPTNLRHMANLVSRYIDKHDIRVTMHPGHFVNPASPTQSTVENSLSSLDAHGRFLDCIGRPRSHDAAINIHVGGHYGDKQATLNRFEDVYARMPDKVSSRLVVENDDKDSMYSVRDLVHLDIDIPVTFDYHHHQFHPDGLSERSALYLAATTWDTRQLTHYSESPNGTPKHSKRIESYPKNYGVDHDCIIEAKDKELALL